MALHARLLHDLAEIQKHPYPNIKLVPHEHEIRTACLVLTPMGQDPLHFTITFQNNYPLKAPSVRIDSSVHHPNIFGGYICASILNTRDGWTPAYTVKGIAIQLLSFFSSDNLEQDHGGVQNLNRYRLPDGRWQPDGGAFRCLNCLYSRSKPGNLALAMPSYSINLGDLLGLSNDPEPRASECQSTSGRGTELGVPLSHSTSTPPTNAAADEDYEVTPLSDMPAEILVRICDHLESEDLIAFARSWNRIGSARGIVTQFNLLRNRELQCFVLKKSFDELELGVGVQVTLRGRQGQITSEFDLLSAQAYNEHSIRRSVHGLPFRHHLPLAISRRHYQRVRERIQPRLAEIATEARLSTTLPSEVIVSFMSDIVVKLCDQARDASDPSALGRASERAIESYYHLFHLLLCQASEGPSIIRKVNSTLAGVLNGRTSKATIPNLGHLLISLPISDVPVTEKLLKTIVKEAITRNVVWMFDRQQGKGMSELAYLEANEVSPYRLQKTFEASKTSYTLLMFQNTFRQTINRGSGEKRKSVKQMRDQLFDAHGSPPKGTAARLARRIGQLQAINTFPHFINVMEIEMPTAAYFTTLLRGCVIESVKKGYSTWGISQGPALELRRQVDPNVQVRDVWPEETGRRPPPGPAQETSFFPSNRDGGNNNNNWGGLGHGRGRGRENRREGSPVSQQVSSRSLSAVRSGDEPSSQFGRPTPGQ
ncbi:uncharacterized protein HMPREF1541_02128 [Cyphellophora europaea CBS 101466]|uniref:UBC core domain-containing protein n=1 Tax=Cyphellophora europaea (strain CBS 101466) TaxID=1220924 RepID=W2S302_CYPE1|nr:uncharacterized protein HMPREF1541_02128 [Cyphellophora europaea CBS 101466]ETN42970.1 hypothetical protein HMPREF1541_02128 [Cyphellophora europaea CBS 101466]